jgi:hypothetical protein
LLKYPYELKVLVILNLVTLQVVLYADFLNFIGEIGQNNKTYYINWSDKEQTLIKTSSSCNCRTDWGTHETRRG